MMLLTKGCIWVEKLIYSESSFPWNKQIKWTKWTFRVFWSAAAACFRTGWSCGKLLGFGCYANGTSVPYAKYFLSYFPENIFQWWGSTLVVLRITWGSTRDFPLCTSTGNLLVNGVVLEERRDLLVKVM